MVCIRLTPFLLLFLAAPSIAQSSTSKQWIFGADERDREHIASLPVPNPTHSFWTHSSRNPLATRGSSGPLTADADICIIGSGMTGVGAAHAISQMDLESSSKMGLLKVVILEARDFCSGATGRNGGHLTANPFLSFSANSRAYGTREALRSHLLENHTTSMLLPFAVDVDLVRGRRVKLLLEKDEEDQALKDWEEARRQGWDPRDVEWVSEQKMMNTYGTLHSSIMYPGNTLWPLKLVAQLYHHASASGNVNLTLHTHTPVTSITPLPRGSFRRQTLHTPRGPVLCTSVLHASNGYATFLLPHLHIVPTRGQIIGFRGQNPAWSAGSRWGWGWAANRGWEYWTTRGQIEERLILIGGAREASRSDPPLETYNTDDGGKNEEVGRKLREFLGIIFPVQAKKPEVVWEWTGIMGYTRTGDPFVGPILVPSPPSKQGVYTELQTHEGEFVSAGYSGHGMPRAYGCAEVVGRMMVNELQDMREERRKHSDGGAMRREWSGKWGGEVEMRLPEWFPRRYLTWNRMGHE